MSVPVYTAPGAPPVIVTGIWLGLVGIAVYDAADNMDADDHTNVYLSALPNAEVYV